MGVSAASATAMVKKLATLGLVEHSPLPRRHPHAAGREGGARGGAPPPAARGVPDARPWACSLGPASTPRPSGSSTSSRRSSRPRSTAALGYPATDPHGDPIPTPDLVIAAEPAQRMAELEPGQAARGAPGPRRRSAAPALPRGRSGLVPDAPFTDGREGPVRAARSRLTSAARTRPSESSVAGRIGVEVTA